MQLLNVKHFKIKYLAAVVFLIAACVSTLGMLVFSSMVSTSQYEVTGLKVEQKGTALKVNWNRTDAPGYAVFLQCNGERPKWISTDKQSCVIPLDVLDKEYKVTVTAKNSFGGLSAAVSDSIMTKKLPQKIETAKEGFVGLEGKSADMETEAHGKITYESSNPEVVTVSGRGVMTYEKEGHARISISVDEGPQYKAAKKTVSIKVYPDTLKTPSLKVTDLTDTTATLKWKKVAYAKGYTLRKYSPVKDKYVDAEELDADTTSVQLPRDEAKYKLQATATIGTDKIESEPSKAAKIESTAASAETYGSSFNLGTLDYSTLTPVAGISGACGATVPQSMSKVGDKYIVTYVSSGGGAGVLVAYSRDGERLYEAGIQGQGHANGSTYNPNTNEIYTVKTHRQIRSAECSSYDPETGETKSIFNLPKVTSGIAYDESNNKYYLSKGNEIYVTDTDFNVEKFIWKKIRYNHAQDIGAYNGVALVCTWVSGHESYIDLYRVSDGGYLGSYYVPIGEIESCFVDDKHLIILMNNAGNGYGDCILRTVEPISIP